MLGNPTLIGISLQILESIIGYPLVQQHSCLWYSKRYRKHFKVTKQNNVDNDAYAPEENIVSNPNTYIIQRTYTFDINATDMPFSIRTSINVDDDSNLYNEGVSQQKIENGKITWKIDLEAPDTLYYVNGNDIEASGLIIIKNIIDNTFLDVDLDIVGKKTYKMQNGYELSNGMKLEFFGDVSPSKYGEGTWYVEGVGDSIKLIAESDLSVSAGYLSDIKTQFDGQAFDALPFDDALSTQTQKDYIVINKGSQR